MTFWLLAAAMTAVAMAFAIVPLVRTRAAQAPSEAQANLDVLRGQRREVEADIAAGLLPADARQEVLDELVARTAEDVAEAAPGTPAGTPSRPWPAIVLAGLGIPAIALATYLAVGNPAATQPSLAQPAAPPMDDRQIVAMVENLARKMKERPDDPRGWALLARSMSSLERFEEAAEAYANLVRLVPNDAQVLADYADALGMAQGRRLAGKPTELVARALAIDPDHPKALALAGTAALDRGDYAAALAHWQRLAAQIPAGSEDARQVAMVIEDVRARAQKAGVALPGASAVATAKAATPAAKPAAPSKAGSVSGTVRIDPALAAKVTGNETVFIFARAEGGPRTPLAVKRVKAGELPQAFTLDDGDAMAPGMNLSNASAVRIEARLSRSGEAAARSGDLTGASAVVKPGARDVEVVISKVTP